MARRRRDLAPDRLSFDRRTLLKTVGAAALLGTVPAGEASAAQGPTYPVTFRGMPGDGPGRPRICLGAPANPDDAQIRRLKQIGVSHVLMGGPPAPWKEEDLKARMDRYKAGGVEIINMMIGGFNDVIWGGPKAEEQTANVVESIKVAGKVGLPVVEYNFYAHRLTEGYKLEEGRAGAGYTAYDYTLSKDLPPREGVARTRARSSSNARDASSRPSCRWPRRPTCGWRCTRTIRRCRCRAAPSRSWPASSSGRRISSWSRARSTG